MSEQERYAVGIDPGKSGALVVIRPDGTSLTQTFDIKEYISILSELDPSKTNVVLEKVHSMPMQSAVATFTFGENFGLIKGILISLDFTYKLISPQRWKKKYNLIGTDKKGSVKYCQENYKDVNLLRTPRSRVGDDGIADAYLIARFALEEEYSKLKGLKDTI